MDFLTIVNKMRQESGISSADLATVIGQKGEAKRCVDWCNQAWLDIQAMRQDWLWMKSIVTFQTVAGRPFYTPAQCGLSDFGFWTRETFRNYVNPLVDISIAAPAVVTLQDNRLNAGDTVTFSTAGALPTGLTVGVAYFVVNPAADTFNVALTAGGVPIDTSGTQTGPHTMTTNNALSFIGLRTEVFMSYLDYDNWRNAYQYGALRSVRTRPMVLAYAPDKSLALGPIPDAGYTMIGEYYRVPTEMLLDASVPAMPAKFHMAIVYRAMISYGMFEAATEVVQRGSAETEKWSRRIMFDQMTEIGQHGALA